MNTARLFSIAENNPHARHKTHLHTMKVYKSGAIEGLLSLSAPQPFLVSSRNAPPHKRLLKTELHYFPFVFVV